jgi:fibronectin type 3 domain-containing protein
LTWAAPANSSDPVAGYNVYRATGNSSTYQLLNTSVDVPTTYTDGTIQSGNSYAYYVESVDSQGNQSALSNTFAVSIP